VHFLSQIPAPPSGRKFGSSVLAVNITCDSGRLVSVGMSQTTPEFGKVCEDHAELAAALGLARPI
jgi:hypothetical protein